MMPSVTPRHASSWDNRGCRATQSTSLAAKAHPFGRLPRFLAPEETLPRPAGDRAEFP
jgi:hypothetical protein